MEWIKITCNSKPPTAKIVLLGYNNGRGTEEWVLAGERIIDKYWHGNEHLIPDPTHWMPLPEPPKDNLNP